MPPQLPEFPGEVAVEPKTPKKSPWEIARRRDDSEARLKLIEGYADGKDPEGLQILMQLAVDDIGAVRMAALTALGAYDQPEALQFLLQRTSPDDAPDSPPAIEAVGKWYARHRDGKDFSLQKTIEQMDPPIGGELLYATAVADFRSVRPIALALLNASAPRLRAAAIRTLRYFMDAELTPRLVEFLGEENAWVKCEAAIGCALLKDYDSLPKLIDLLEDPEPVVGQSAHIALKLLVGVPLPPKPDDWREYLKNHPVKPK